MTTKTASARSALAAFVSACGGNPPDWLREEFAAAENALASKPLPHRPPAGAGMGERETLDAIRDLVAAAEQEGWDLTQNREVLNNAREAYAALQIVMADDEEGEEESEPVHAAVATATTDDVGRYIRDMLDLGCPVIDIAGETAVSRILAPGCITEPEGDEIEVFDASDPSNIRIGLASGAVFVVRVIREG